MVFDGRQPGTEWSDGVANFKSVTDHTLLISVRQLTAVIHAWSGQRNPYVRLYSAPEHRETPQLQFPREIGRSSAPRRVE